MKNLLILMIGALGLASCSAQKAATEVAAEPGTPSTIVGGHFSDKSVTMIPKAVVYKTNGDYNQYVPITLNASRTEVISYPAPTDLRETSMPVELCNGWLLDRRGGIGDNTAFTDYTYEQYMQLSAAPSVEELLKHVQPDARVTEVKKLDVTLQEALKDLEKVRQQVCE